MINIKVFIKVFTRKFVNERVLFFLRGIRVTWLYTAASIVCFCVMLFTIFEAYYHRDKFSPNEFLIGLLASSISTWFAEAMHGGEKYSQREAAVASYSFIYARNFESIGRSDCNSDVIKVTWKCLPIMLREVVILREKRFVLDVNEGVHLDRIIAAIEGINEVLREIVNDTVKQIDVTNIIFVHSVTSNIINNDVLSYAEQQSIEVGMEYLTDSTDSSNTFSQRLSRLLAKIYMSMTCLDMSFRDDAIVRSEVKNLDKKEKDFDDVSLEKMKMLVETRKILKL